MAEDIVVEIPEEKLGKQSDRPNSKRFPLPSGRIADVRKGKGRDLIAAQKVAKADSALDLGYALIAQLVLIDGKPIKYEDVLEMDLEDAMKLQEEVAGANFPKARSSPAQTSQG